MPVSFKPASGPSRIGISASASRCPGAPDPGSEKCTAAPFPFASLFRFVIVLFLLFAARLDWGERGAPPGVGCRLSGGGAGLAPVLVQDPGLDAPGGRGVAVGGAQVVEEPAVAAG